jgi:hypothetical protein
MSSDGDLRQWDTVLRRNVSYPPPGTWNCASADTAIHAPGKPRGEDEQNAEDHGGPVLRGRSKEVGRPSSGADVRPQHLTPRVDQVHASAAELWPRTCGTQRRPPPCTRKCHRHPPADTAADEVNEADDAVHHSERLRLLKDTFELVRVNLARAFAKQSKYYNLRHREWRCHLGDRVLKRDHPLSSGAKSFAAKLAPKYSGPYTITKVLSPVVYNLQSPSGQKILRAHIKDLKPYQLSDPPADIANILQDVKSTVATAAKRSAERPPAAKPKTGRPGRPPERSTAGRPQDPGAVPTSTAESPGREDGDPDHPERPERACSATAGPDASGLNCQRGSLLAPADRNPIDLDASVALNLDHRRPSRNHCSRHHGVANTGELPTRRPARADTGGPPKTPTVSPRDASPTAPPPKDEASAHGGTRAPVCPARWNATGSRKHDREPGTRRPPPLSPDTTGNKKTPLI